VLHLKHSFVWCWNYDTSESISEIPGTFQKCCWRRDRSVGRIM